MIDSVSKENLTHNAPIYSVGEISIAIKTKIEKNFDHVRIRGEISGFKKATSGHFYFALKDETSVLDSICWRGTAKQLKIFPEDGLEIIALGRLTTYGARSKYQMIIESIELSGEGTLLKLLEERKRKLANEGFFDDSLKQKLPFLPEKIGVITSLSGAVIRDILHRLNDRFNPNVLIWPVSVQGEGAAEQITAAINGFNSLSEEGQISKPDLLIVARGGGSLEDLWVFNEEIVVKAAALSKIPLISAIGHETDTTLIDYASDKRAPTPSAAAEMAVPVRREVLFRITENSQRLDNAINRIIQDFKLYLESIARGLPNLPRLLGDASQRLDDWGERLGNGLKTGIRARHQHFSPLSQRLRPPDQIITLAKNNFSSGVYNFNRAGLSCLREKQAQLEQISSLLNSYSYERTLDRGFVLLLDSESKSITSATKLYSGEKVSATFHDGIKNLQVIEERLNPKVSKKNKNKINDPSQGSLL